MIVNLAGLNVDVENINLLKETLKNLPELHSESIEKLKAMEWTPETISASYGRISRSPLPINILREKARAEVEKARKSNTNIIFEMGHSSIAEHAVFNIDIIDISRFLSEELEKSRLVSFTEKSQRYVKIGGDVFYPEEFLKDKIFFEKFKKLTSDLFGTYNSIHEKLVIYFSQKFPVTDTKSRAYRDVINLAKEDARYILPLSALTQLGMTINSRSLEKVIRKLSAFCLAESRDLAGKLFSAIEGYAPSLVKYTKPTEYETLTYPDIKSGFENTGTENIAEEVVLVNYDINLEDKVIAALLLKSSSLSYQTALETVKKWDKRKKKDILNKAVLKLNSFDGILKEFETACFEFNILILATAFAQLKRHRMATIIDGEYSPSLGYKIPLSIIDTGTDKLFLENINKADELFYEAYKMFGLPSNYILTNAHRKNVLLKCNFRELVHISRLRADVHAQWDIRELTEKIISRVEEKFPVISHLLCGKII